MASIEKVFLKTIFENKLVSRGDRVLLAVSGGVDSVGMLYLFYKFKEKLGIKIAVGHFNHCLRGKQADQDENFVKKLAEKMEIPFYSGRANVKKFAFKLKTSLENAGRFLRYKFLKKSAEKFKANKIATAHNLEDQVETFFLRILRGSSLKGLSGILFERQDNVIRPMLFLSRKEIENFLNKNKIKFRKDPSNKSLKFLRNRIRHQLLPFLEKINPKIKETIVRNSFLIQEEENWLEEFVEKIFKKICFLEKSNVKLVLKKFLNLPRPLQRRILKRIFEKIVESDKEVGARHIEIVLNKVLGAKKQILKAKTGGRRLFTLHLPGPVYVYNNDKFLIFSKKPPLILKIKNFKFKVKPGKTYRFLEIGKKVSFKVSCKVPSLSQIKKFSPKILFLDFTKTGQNLFIRNRLPGDRFQPLGQKKTKKLKNFLIDRKIYDNAKDRYPVLINKKGQVLAVIGLEVSENFKISPETSRVLMVKTFNLT